VPRCLLGGTSIPFEGDFNHGDTLLYTMAEKGLAKFIEVEKLDSNAKHSVISPVSANTATSEKLWAPASTSGFSYSLWLRLQQTDNIETGNVFVLDISSPSSESGGSKMEFISLWYDLTSMGFNVISSSWLKPICFPASPLSPGVWHHI